MNDPSNDESPILAGGALELLFEASDLPKLDLPKPLFEAYGGGLGFARPCVVANFVSSVDGVVALPVDVESGQVVSGGSDADHFVMGLLRACADVVMVGAGTYRKAARDLFHAEAIYPAAAPWYAALRRRLGLPERPRFVLVTASGAVDPSGPALEGGIIVTTTRGQAALGDRVSSQTRIVALSGDSLRLAEVLALLRAGGAGMVLTEGGPSLFAELVRGSLVDELFVTTSPALLGRFADDGRKSLAQGFDLSRTPLTLASVRRHGSHLFSRYRIAKTEPR
ncbi:5-amino-6-(5-phosphoribosylamino)uracil reductase [Minicystis rosea]|nr:5-amino-6-(5-phosphoribosylamino)uracil reductase [Minicystis rosea]